jgi:uncharacterized membrane protein
MNWNRWYAARSYLRSALWIVPLVALVIEQIAIRVTSAMERIIALKPIIDWIPETAATPAAITAMMDTVVTLTISFVVFTFGSMLVAIQIAGGQLTPRIIATTLLRDNTIRLTVGLFVFTLLYAAGTRARIGDEIPKLAVDITEIVGMGSIVAFLYLIDYTARLLRPISILWRIAERGLSVVETVYPDAAGPRHRPASLQQRPAEVQRVIEHHGRSAIVLAVNLKALVKAAEKSGGITEFVPRVGDFVSSGEPLFRLYGGAKAIRDRVLRAQVAFGPERTIEQDPTFAFRVVVDVAIKALSKAINDPTTAVLAIDQLHRLLRLVGKRHLHDDALFDSHGTLRVIFRTPNWEDFVGLTFSEIRLYGSENFQVTRRLRAMIENLSATLPKERQPALHRELDLLDRTVEKVHQLPEDVALARQSDLQGLGGTSVRDIEFVRVEPGPTTRAEGET